MHNAPPVAFPVGRFVWGRVAWFGAALLSAVGLVGWQVWAHTSSVHVMWAWVFWCVCVVASAVGSPRQSLSGGRLFWTGEAWFWQADGANGQTELHSLTLTVGLDAGAGLLLWVRLLEDGYQTTPKKNQLRYAWMQANMMPSKWHGFRCAVYSNPKSIDPSKRSLNGQV